jgi:hypothetical protein
MRLTLAAGLRACGCAGALFLAGIRAADDSASPIGATREQILSAYGEPRSAMVAGNQEILWFARERMVLRDGVVIEVEPLASGVARPSSPEAVPAAGDTGMASEAGELSPAQPGAASPRQSASTDAPVEVPRPVPGAAGSTDSHLTIKSVRPPKSEYTRPETKEPTKEPSSSDVPPVRPGPTPPPRGPLPAATFPLAGSAVLTPPVSPSAADQPDAPAAPAPAEAAAPASVDEEIVLVPGAVSVRPGTSVPEIAPGGDPTLVPAQKLQAGDTAAPPEFPEPVERLFTVRTYLVAFLVFFGGVAFFFWRLSQRRLEMAASSVAGNPFAPPLSAGGAARFTPDLLSKLEWKRFEELVASYYGKTGVVAVRTKSGPTSPVHIKISWKGEPRPFACVRCIAHPSGLIDAKPVQELFENISAEDIRRGYVVSTGKFSVAARDFAEEKHLTLMPGDLLLEKLNALPDQARAELLKEITNGDYSTPSCPRCDTRMVHSPNDALVWHCPKHPDVTIPVWK